ncbi:hypothetical protein [Priestia sp. HNGD-A6]|uniref:hypothetical protein n=1 Tax=Priestia sp. HNGD-A6 TaxID=3092666 RepID=UPI003892471C
MIDSGYYTGSLFVRELERLKEEYIQLELDDMRVLIEEDILLIEKAMDMLCRNKIYQIEQTIQDVSKYHLIQLHSATEKTYLF